jgi:hypothetical protein
MLSRASARPLRPAWWLAAAALLVLASPADAQWKWRDARGQIHISDIPPPRDVPDKDVLQRPPASTRQAQAPVQSASAASSESAASAAMPAKAGVDPALEERRRQAQQQQAARSKAEEDKLATSRKENCQRAREHLATLDSGLRIARVKPDGQREILDDQQRAVETQRTRQAIAADCR